MTQIFELETPKDLSFVELLRQHVRKFGESFYITSKKKYSTELRSIVLDLDTHSLTLKPTELSYATKSMSEEYIHKQLEAAKIELSLDIHTRRAVIDFWRKIPHSDAPPCWVSCQFMFRRGTLETYVFQRSMDIEKMADDIAFIYILSRTIRDYMGIVLHMRAHKMRMHYFVSNLHCYK